MLEVEVKASADLSEARELLDGDDREREVRQSDTYYSAPHRDFSETDEALRIRSETRLDTDDEERTYVTYKGPKLDSETKSRVEHETRVGSREALHGVLDSLGFEEFETVTKRRSVYETDGFTVTLDEIEGLGEFVEVEKEVEGDQDTDEYDEARQGCLDFLAELGYDDVITRSYLELLVSEREERA